MNFSLFVRLPSLYIGLSLYIGSLYPFKVTIRLINATINVIRIIVIISIVIWEFEINDIQKFLLLLTISNA